MRKGKGFFKNLEIYSTYRIRGVNLDGLLNALVKKGIEVIEAQKRGNKTLIVKVKFCQNEKFFAILKDLCYTDIVKLKDSGKAYPLLYLFRNMGLLIGGILFIVFSAVINDFIFSFSFVGSGRALSNEVQAYLQESGVKPFVRFSNLDMASLSDGILASNPRLSFADCRKVGNRLEIQLALSKDQERVLEGDKQSLISDANGVIEELKVYRGRAVVSVGDEVCAGDLLVSGTDLIQGQEVQVGVIAYVTLRAQFEFEYVGVTAEESDLAILYAQALLGEAQAVSEEVFISEQSGKFIYKVKLTYKRVLFTG